MINNRRATFYLTCIGLASLALAVSATHIVPTSFSGVIANIQQNYIHLFLKGSVPGFKLVAIEVDDYTLKMMPRWPWKRSLFAELIRMLDAEHCRSIGMDFIFAGDSEDKKQDQLLAEAIHSASCPIVLGIGHTNKDGSDELLLPAQPIMESGCLLGLVNSPAGGRRMRSSIVVDRQTFHSFVLQNSAAFLGTSAFKIEERLAGRMDRHRTFPINYFVTPEDRRFLRISFLDALEGMDKLKKQYGEFFLKDALVIVYSSAEIEHDLHDSPVGRIPGGLLHINGILTVISGKVPKSFFPLDAAMIVFAGAVVVFLLARAGFMTGLVMTGGLLLLCLWMTVISAVNAVQIDFPLSAIFITLFFIAGSLYKYLTSLIHLLVLKNKLTYDPVRGTFTMRYFYYRTGFEASKLYLFQKIFLVFFSLKGFKEETADLSLDSVRGTWKAISSVISAHNSFWATYSNSEIIGCVRCRPRELVPLVRGMKTGLEIALKEKNVQVKVHAGWTEVPRFGFLKELLHILFKRLGERQESDTIEAFPHKDLKAAVSMAPSADGSQRIDVLDSLDEDIEEKNRHLMTLVEDLNRESARSREVFFQVITSLVNALEARDPYTQGHSDRVCKYSLLLAEKLGWNREDRQKLSKAAMLHDLGKIGIPDGILHKPGKLTDEEYDFIKKHEIIGVRILEPISELKEILPWILYHHERWDGKGYPHGLAANSIPLASQIISIADVFDALTTGRDYKVAMSFDDSVKEIVRNKGTQFNPELVDLFVRIVAFEQSASLAANSPGFQAAPPAGN